MSRCKACDAVMKKCDYTQYNEEREEEEDICLSCRQEIFKYDDECIALGFSVEELDDMLEGFFRDFRQGKIDDDRYL